MSISAQAIDFKNEIMSDNLENIIKRTSVTLSLYQREASGLSVGLSNPPQLGLIGSHTKVSQRHPKLKIITRWGRAIYLIRRHCRHGSSCDTCKMLAIVTTLHRS